MATEEKPNALVGGFHVAAEKRTEVLPSTVPVKPEERGSHVVPDRKPVPPPPKKDK
jgi:hypothetical protein